MPTAQFTLKDTMASASSRADWRKLYAATGMNTFSSKLPWDAAMPTATSLPITCTATMVTASHWVGFTLPGIIEEPGSFSGMWISPRPSRGPDASQRTSFAIFIISQAVALMAPCANTSSSLEVSAWNLFSAVIKGLPVSSATFFATSSENPAGAFRPVPTAVPPSASSCRGFTASFSSSTSFSRLARQPEISWLNLMGVASCKWVLPDLTMPSFSASRRRKVSIRVPTAGSSLSSMASTAEMCIAVGNVSLEDWLILMSSLGWQSFSPAIWFARFAMTSLAFMLD